MTDDDQTAVPWDDEEEAADEGQQDPDAPVTTEPPAGTEPAVAGDDGTG